MVLNIFFIAVAAISILLKTKSILAAVKEKNTPKLKAELFFLGLMVLVIVLVLWLINR